MLTCAAVRVLAKAFDPSRVRPCNHIETTGIRVYPILHCSNQPVEQEDFMNHAATLPRNTALRWAAWWEAVTASLAACAQAQRTRDTAASLYERAAHYENTQPSFAADLRAAAEGLDRVAAQRRR
jgi:hypothetical protein